LTLEHCTFEGAGLLNLTNSHVRAPLQLEVRYCAVRAEALLACTPRKPEEPPTAQFDWQGRGNQYDIHGHFWIARSAGQEIADPPVTDLVSWLRVAPKDHEPSVAKLRYHTDTGARPAAPRPQDFAIEASGPLETTPGADAHTVGPGSNP
jgi:hypothetical protein